MRHSWEEIPIIVEITGRNDHACGDRVLHASSLRQVITVINAKQIIRLLIFE